MFHLFDFIHTLQSNKLINSAKPNLLTTTLTKTSKSNIKKRLKNQTRHQT